MAFGVKLKVWGEYASFNRPEMKVERVTYDVMTPSAARGVLEAIYWKPQMRWVIDRIHLLAPIRTTQVRRNEIASKIPVKGTVGAAAALKGSSVPLGLDVSRDRQQRAAIILRDVAYGIEAHVDVLDARDRDGRSLARPEGKHLEMFRRRAANGQYFHHPYLGCREFPAHFELVDEFAPAPGVPQGELDLGYMLHDVVWRPAAKGERSIVESNRGRRLVAEPTFFRARMVDGVLAVPPLSAAVR